MSLKSRGQPGKGVHMQWWASVQVCTHTEQHRKLFIKSLLSFSSSLFCFYQIDVLDFSWNLVKHLTFSFSPSVFPADAPVHSVGYQSLVGNNEHSWGWDLGRSKVYHDSKNSPGQPYPAGGKPDETFTVPDKFLGNNSILKWCP